MELKKARTAVAELAARLGKSEEEIIEAIEIAIDDAIRKSERENNTRVLKKWKQIPCKGEVPTAYELITYLGDAVWKRYDKEENVEVP